MDEKQKAMERIGALIKAKAIRKCPIDMGKLRASIDYKIEGDEIIIFSTEDYAEAMEYGKPPEPLSSTDKNELEAWAKRHGANPSRIIKYIEEHGIKVGSPENPMHITSYGRDSYRPFIRPAIFESQAEIARIMAEGIVRDEENRPREESE